MTTDKSSSRKQIGSVSAGLRPVAPVPALNVRPNELGGPPPEVRWVAPGSLLIEGSYQRDLSQKSMTLLRKIVGGWDWAAMKPPICAITDGGDLVVIDGQHTAIAAATHPAIGEIPILIVQATAVRDRAGAFVKHNADRIAMTSMQVHHAALAAGDEVAVAMAEAARRAGATILRNTPPQGLYAVGDTSAVATLRKMTNEKGLVFAARVLRILVGAMRAPLVTAEIKAVRALLSEPEWRGSIADEDLTLLIRSKSMSDWEAFAESRVRKGLKIPLARALAIAWFQNAPKRRRAA